MAFCLVAVSEALFLLAARPPAPGRRGCHVVAATDRAMVVMAAEAIPLVAHVDVLLDLSRGLELCLCLAYKRV